MRKSVALAWMGLLVFLAAVSPLPAQTSGTGALTGSVTDPSGAVVPNVTVRATNTGTGQSRIATTGSSGSYDFSLLPPGIYKIRFEAAGFKTLEVPAVNIAVTETETLDRSLELGAQTQEVTVNGSVEAVQTASSALGTVIDTRTVTEIPLSTRNYTNLLSFSAGANASVNNATSLGKGSQDIAVNGTATSQNNFQMDGVSILPISGRGSTLENGSYPAIGIPNPDAISEFKIQTSSYDASYGRNPGANVNVVTKSGTNAFHGSAFDFFRNTSLNANDFFLNYSGKHGRLDQNQYGGTFGGPVKKDKLFFFTSYQYTWQKNGFTSWSLSNTVLPPIPGNRSSAGFQAALGAAISPLCPGTANVNNSFDIASSLAGSKTGAGKQVGTQVACNGSNINPVALAILQLQNPDGSYFIPGSSLPGQYQSLSFTIPAIYKEYQGMGNWDYVINSRNTLSGRYFVTTDPTLAPFSCGGTNVNAVGVCTPGVPIYFEFRNHEAVLRLTSILSNTFVNEARVSFQRNNTVDVDNVPWTNEQVGIQSVSPAVTKDIDTIVVSGEFQAGTWILGNQTLFDNQEQYADQISWTHNKHAIRAGFEVETMQSNWNVPALSIGTLTFPTFADFLIGLPGCNAANGGLTPCNGTTFSNISSTGSVTTEETPPSLMHHLLVKDLDSYFQDDFKVNSRLTLNLGLRWEYDGLFADKNGQVGNIWASLVKVGGIPGTTPATGSLAGFVVPANYNFAKNPAPPVAGIYQSSLDISTNAQPKDNFAPRIGLAWEPTKSNRFVVRSGFGYFYDRVPGANLLPAINQNEPQAVTIGQGSADPTGFPSFARPYNLVPVGWTPRWVNFAAGTSSNLPITSLAQNFTTPLVFQWNLNTQYEFLPGWVLEVGYVGSHGIHQDNSGIPFNAAQLASPANPVNGVITTNTTSNAPLRVPLLGIAASTTEIGTPYAEKFNSLQATVRKLFSHGLQFQAAYTWSKAEVTTYNDSPFQPLYNPNPSYRPQRLVVNYSWDVPINRSGWMGKFTNGWGLAGVTIIQDGLPVTITDSRAGTVYGVGTYTAQFASGMGNSAVGLPGGLTSKVLFGLNNPSAAGGYLNPAAFTTPPIVGTDGKATGAGDSGSGIILGPGQFNWDMSLIKSTKVGGIHEDAMLTFRAEFFNAFNHPQFNLPASNFAQATFGHITTSSVNPRLIQFALKYAF